MIVGSSVRKDLGGIGGKISLINRNEMALKARLQCKLRYFTNHLGSIDRKHVLKFAQGSYLTKW